MKELTLPAARESVPEMIAFVNGLLAEMRCPARLSRRIGIVIDEVLANIAGYAYGEGRGTMTVRFQLEEHPLTAVITFVDRGQPFNPLQAPPPDLTPSAEKRPVGGLGVFLVKKTMDDVTYLRLDGQNILTIRKQIRAE